MNPDVRSEIESFFLAHRQPVGGYVCARVGDVDAAESIAGRVFLTVVRCWAQCHSSRTAWLWTIVRSEIARYFRDRREPQSLEEISDQSPRPDEQAVLREARLQMRVALTQLNDDQREIIFLKYFEQMRNREIAELTGRSAENVGVIVHRALNRLRQLMESCNTSVAK